MIIDCPDCNKKFDINQNLIPASGRLLQCGSCNHEWFFKFKVKEKKLEEEIKINNEKDFNKNNISPIKDLKKDIADDETEIISTKKKARNNINYLNVLLVIILSVVAFILILDTFKDHLSLVFPNINFLLNNLYQSITDIKLFTLDLIK